MPGRRAVAPGRPPRRNAGRRHRPPRYGTATGRPRRNAGLGAAVRQRRTHGIAAAPRRRGATAPASQWRAHRRRWRGATASRPPRHPGGSHRAAAAGRRGGCGSGRAGARCAPSRPSRCGRTPATRRRGTSASAASVDIQPAVHGARSNRIVSCGSHSSARTGGDGHAACAPRDGAARRAGRDRTAPPPARRSSRARPRRTTNATVQPIAAGDAAGGVQHHGIRPARRRDRAGSAPSGSPPGADRPARSRVAAAPEAARAARRLARCSVVSVRPRGGVVHPASSSSSRVPASTMSPRSITAMRLRQFLREVEILLDQQDGHVAARRATARSRGRYP